MKRIFNKAALLALAAPFAFAAHTVQAAGLGAGLGLDVQSIIGGTEARRGDAVARSTVLLVGKDGKSTFICSGSIIAEDIVLTAAHCLGLTGDAPLVVAFRTNIEGEGPLAKVIDRRVMRDFYTRAGTSEHDWHDLALVKLDAKIPPGFSVAKILPDASRLQSGSTVTLAGYGMTTPTKPARGSTGSGVLRKVTQSVINPQYGGTEFLVSLANNRGACHGDSGGPAFLGDGENLLLVGVASRMTEADRVANNGDVNDFSCSVEIVYTSVLAQMGWIQQAMGELAGSSFRLPALSAKAGN